MPDEVEVPEVLAASVPAAGEPAGEPELDKTETAQAAGEGDQDEKDKPKGGFQRRIDKLTREKADKEREAEYWREQALRAPKPESTVKPAEVKSDKPKLDDFSNEEEYFDALTDWKVDQRFAKAKADQEAAQTAEKKKTEQQTIAQQWEGQVAKGREAHTDFEEVAFSKDVPITDTMTQAIITSELGGEIAYYLGTHVEEAKKIAGLSPVAQAREIGKIELRVAGEESAGQEVTPVVTKTPAPVKPVSKATVSDTGLRDDLPPDEWAKRFRARLEKSRH